MGDNRLEPLVLSEAERRTLENWAKRRKTAQGLALRARIVLACAEGRSNTAVSARLGISRTTVTKWRARFLARRLDGLGDEPRPGVPRTITDAQVEEVVVRTLEETPEGATHWSKRELARQVGISATSVHRIWRAFGLQPWRTEEFKISPDPFPGAGPDIALDLAGSQADSKGVTIQVYRPAGRPQYATDWST
jgi:transposase